MLETINRFDDTYQIIKNKKNSKIISFTTILFILIIIFMIYFFFYPIKQTETYYGTIFKQKGDMYVVFKTSYLSEYLFNKKIYPILEIDNRVVNYEIVDIINNKDYNEIILKLQLNYEPRIIKLTFLLKEKTLFEKLKEDFRWKEFQIKN